MSPKRNRWMGTLGLGIFAFAGIALADVTVRITSTAPASTSESPIPIQAVFSTAVVGFEATDIAVVNGTVTAFSGSGTTYTFGIIPYAQGDVSVSVPPNVCENGSGVGNSGYVFSSAMSSPQGQLNSPSAVASDSAGNVYVANYDDGNLQKFDSAGNFLALFRNIYLIVSITLDSSGNFFVGDSGNSRVMKFDPSGSLLATIGGYGSGDGQFRGAYGTALDATGNYLYVADGGNHRVQKFTADGAFVSKWGGFGSGDSQFNYPNGLALDSAGNVYVADSANHRIQKFTSEGVFVTKWGSSGSGNVQFSYPSGVALDSAGNIYVADTYNARIQKLNASGAYVTQWGGFGSGDGQFSRLGGVTVDGDGRILVADTGNNRIQVFSASGEFLAKWGYSPKALERFSRPFGIAMDSGDNCYVSDSLNDRVKKYDVSGNLLLQFGTYGTGDGQFVRPQGIAVDASGHIYVTDSINCRIQEFDASGVFLTKWGSFGSGDGQFNVHHGIAVDGDGNVYVADTQNNRIQKFTATGVFVSKWGSEGSGDGQFVLPYGIAVDASGNVYVADYGNRRVQKFAGDGSFLGKWGSYGWGSGQFDSPGAVAVDGDGRMYVSDSGGNRIQILDAAGNPLDRWGTAGYGEGQFNSPYGVALNSARKIYVADYSNNRLQIFEPVILKRGYVVPPPSGSVSVDAGSAYARTEQAILTLSLDAHPGQGAVEMRLSNDNSTWTAWQAFTSSLPWTLSAGEGSKTVYVEFRDTTYSLSGGPYSDGIVLDTVAPGAPTVSGSTPVNTLTPTWWWTPGGGGNGTFRYRIDNSDLSSNPVETSQLQLTAVSALTEATHTLYVQERDDAGNWSDTGSFSVTIDRTPPVPPVVTSTTPVADATPEWTWSSGGGGNGSYRFRLDNADLSSGATATSERTYTPGSPLAEGTHTLYVQERDGVGNWSSSGQCTITIALGTTRVVTLPGGVALEMKWIPAGTFTMGSPGGETGRVSDEGPAHEVTLTQGFWLGRFPVTQAQWKSIMEGTDPAYFTGDDLPVEMVSWSDVTHSFIPTLNEATGMNFRLPTEAEWEYACRAGTSTRYYWGDDSEYSLIGSFAWYAGNAGGHTRAVGTAGGPGNPNAFGLYDMAGNVSELCQDWYAAYDSGSATDPAGPLMGTFHVVRGGSYAAESAACRSAARDTAGPYIRQPYIGFRLACPDDLSGEGEGSIEGEIPPEGEAVTEGETQTEGEAPTEGEPSAEGETATEGESATEGEFSTEGESVTEGEAINEGEISEEGEVFTEGEMEEEGESAVEGELPGDGEAPIEGEDDPEGELPCGGLCDVQMWMPDRFMDQDGCVLFPISVTSANAISPNGIDITVQYDPSFLDPGTVEVQATAITGRMSFTPDTSTPGVIRILAIGGNTGGLRGEGHLFDIKGCVSEGGATTCTQFDFADVLLAESLTSILDVDYSDTGQACLESHAFLCDVNGDGAANVLDVMTLLALAVGKKVEGVDTEAAVKAGDLNGDGVLDSADAVMLQRYMANWPVNPQAYQNGEADPMLLSMALSSTERVTVMVEDESGAVGGTAQVSVYASTAYALCGYDVTLRYDPAVLRAIDALPGTVVGDSPQDHEIGEGYINVSMGRKEAYAAKTVNPVLATVTFEVLSMPPNGRTPIQLDTPALKGQYGDSFKWYTSILKENGLLTVLPGEGETEGESSAKCGPVENSGTAPGGDALLLLLLAGMLATFRRMRKEDRCP